MSNPTGRNADPRRAIPLNSAEWQRLRESVLANEPLCRHCRRLGRVEAATDVDHADGNPGNNARENLQPLCHSHHSYKTGRERAGKAPLLPGCDARGVPADPQRGWHDVFGTSPTVD